MADPSAIPRCNGCHVLGLAVVLCSLVLRPVWLWLGPHFVAAFYHGFKFRIPDPVSPLSASLYGVDHIRRLGSTRFADPWAYIENDPITEEHRRQYFREGYLLIRGLIPRETVEALREEMLRTLGFLNNPYNENTWFMSDALFDFLVFGPFGKVTAKLFGTEDIRLFYSNHNLRRGDWPAYQAGRRWHWDSIQCCSEHYVPASKPLESNLNFQIALVDDMPGMHFVNQSSTVELLRLYAIATNRSGLLKSYLEGRLPRVVPQQMMEYYGQKRFDALAIRPRLQVGDAIVHSPALLHRSPDGYGGRPSGWLLPSYASGHARFVPLPYMVDRLCDTGEDLTQHHYTDFFGTINATAFSKLKDVPQQNCFPKVYPPAAARGQQGEYSVSFRRHTYPGLWTGTMDWFRASHMTLMPRARQGPDLVSLRPPSYNDVPPSNVLNW